MKRQLAFIAFMGLFVVFVFSSTLIIGGCGGDGDGGFLLPRGAPAPSINTVGGDGGSDTGVGGAGGPVYILKFGGTGPTEILNSGTVDASFTPTAPAPILGANSLSITTSTTITVEVVEPPAGTPYLVQTDSILRISNGNTILGDEPPVTGLSVDAGATLTLELNSGGTAASIQFSDDVVNNGTITTLDANPTQRGDLSFDFYCYYGASGSAVDTSATAAGQNGGDIELYTWAFALNAGFYNRGAINTAGADDPGGNGGNGGYVEIGGWEPCENSGRITTAGGTGGAGAGGAGGHVYIASGITYLYNSGAINSRGGNGTGSGGQGGDVEIYTVFFGAASGELRNTGNVTTAGGNGAGGAGGPGGNIELIALAADLLNNANLNSAGGDTSEATSGGGAGGYIWVAAIPDFTAGQGDNLLLAGNIESSGGNALASGSGNGGNGGIVEIALDASGSYWPVTGLPAPTTQRLALFNSDSIDTSGGSGNQGGFGGNVLVLNIGEEWDGAPDWTDAPGGDVTNQAAITARGGSVAAGASTPPAMGGFGGLVQLIGDPDTAVTNPAAEYVNNNANIDTSSGDSRELVGPGFNAGPIYLLTTNDVTNTGALTANGGSDSVNDDTFGTGFGGFGSLVILEGIAGDATNSGGINGNGGDGETQGGAGANLVWLGDVQVVNSANISVRGGDADTGVAGSVGGAGGNIVIDDDDGWDNTGSLNVSGGAGETAGADGTITEL